MSAVPVRAALEIVGRGSLELHPFTRTGFPSGVWPDDGRPLVVPRVKNPLGIGVLANVGDGRWAVERTPRGWEARTSGRVAPLVVDVPVQFHGATLVLRALDLPLACVRARLEVPGVGLLAFVDVPWPLSARAPRRLAVMDGALVEVLCAGTGQRATWSVRAATCHVPLPWLALVEERAVRAVTARPWHEGERGEGGRVDSHVDSHVIELDGALREVPLTEDDCAGVMLLPDRRPGPLVDGAVERLFAARVAEWRALVAGVAGLGSEA